MFVYKCLALLCWFIYIKLNMLDQYLLILFKWIIVAKRWQISTYNATFWIIDVINILTLIWQFNELPFALRLFDIPHPKPLWQKALTDINLFSPRSRLCLASLRTSHYLRICESPYISKNLGWFRYIIEPSNYVIDKVPSKTLRVNHIRKCIEEALLWTKRKVE